jgi:hypothetical protein
MTSTQPTAADVQAWIDDGSFFQRLLNETIFDASKEGPGKVRLDLSLPEWFAHHVSPSSQEDIKSLSSSNKSGRS